MSNTEMDPPAQLRAAARLVERAMAGLNTKAEACGSCGRQQFSDKVEAGVFKRLEEIPRRLRESAEALDIRWPSSATPAGRHSKQQPPQAAGEGTRS